MKVGICGFAGSGKTTVFNALTGLAADTGFRAKDRPNLGTIKIPDPRIDFLTQVYKPERTTYAEISFVDVAGPEAAEGKGGLETRIVTEMRLTDSLVHVIRAFADAARKEAPDPARDLVRFDNELALTDLVQVEARLDRLIKEGKKGVERAFWERLQKHLEAGQPLRTLGLSELERQSVSGFTFLSLKPCLCLVNLPDDQVKREMEAELTAEAARRGMGILALAARAEAEIAQLPREEQQAFLLDLGLDHSARDRFVTASFAQLDLISFLTVGPDECRAWTVPRGTAARRAAGKIHTDLERGFIRAEVMAFEDFRQHPSEAQCREAGRLRSEGKDYVVQDGDILHVRFHV